MQFTPFSISRLPRISYGSGRINEVPALAAAYGRTALLVTGKQSFCATPRWQSFTQSLETRGMRWLHFTVSGEPSPTLVDQAVRQFRGEAVDVVIAIGGGSVLDAAKATARQLGDGLPRRGRQEHPLSRPQHPIYRRSHHGWNWQRGDQKLGAERTRP
jgi:alcohol dehydrogenase class IV